MSPSDYIYGIHAVEAALSNSSPAVELLWLDSKRSDNRISKLEAQARAQSIKVRHVPRDDLERLVSDDVNHQGAVAQVQMPSLRNEAELDGLLEEIDGPPFLLILDGVQDPHNLGACLRSADAAGVDAVIVPKDKACGLTPTVCRIASGAASTVPVFQVTNLVRALKALQKQGVWLVGAAGEAEQTLYELDFKGSIGLVLGAEGKGLRRLTRENCDYLASIPMAGAVSSLNVSVATGVCLFEAVRQRRST
jgi:23S rRNA (guanosine2251-2'-O)-methyltransferase